MSTANALKSKPAAKAIKQKKPATAKPAVNPLIQGGQVSYISLSLLDPSPFNYREFFPKPELEELAADIAQHGIISNLTVRAIAAGRFELVVGERRYRAAAMAGLKAVPANIVCLTDQQVMEIQLSENMHRANPHPMQEARAIGQLQKTRAGIEEIAARIGKSKAFVYNRLKLLSLIEPVQQMFMADKCTTVQAYEIATLSPDSQTEFFEQYCADWKDEDFEMPDTDHTLRQFKYDLSNAPFDINDKKLLPEAGACTGCPFNSATTSTLFPDQAKNAICSKRECYRSKCETDFSRKLKEGFSQHAPQALIYYGSPQKLESIIQLMPEAASLPQYNYYNIDVVSAPEPPERDDYMNEQEAEEGEEAEFDEEGFNQLMQEYREDLEQYELLLKSGKLSEGLLVSENRVSFVAFNPEGGKGSVERKELPKAADVQTAIKEGTVSAELLEGEINRILSRETRSQEIDRDKVQLKVHETFETGIDTLCLEPTAADRVALRLILFQSLDYAARGKVCQSLSLEKTRTEHENNGELYRQLESLDDKQFAYLIRMAIASNPESKIPNSEKGYFLYKMAEQAGMDIVTIEQAQKAKTAERQKRQQERIAGLQKQIDRLLPKE
jgi:ParB/RepB/Spo0J family partition protein